MIELKQMSNFKFYAPFTYYSVLQMSKNIKKLANLTKNEEFLAKFEANLDSFSCYKSDLQEIMAEAVQLKNQLDAVEIFYLTLWWEI